MILKVSGINPEISKKTIMLISINAVNENLHELTDCINAPKTGAIHGDT